jgi:hypothetical protein
MSDTPFADEDAMARMRAIAAELSAAGLDAHLHEGRDSIDITAISKPVSGGREIEAVVDDDGYVELRYWNQPDATPAQVRAVIVRVLDVITSDRG